MAPVPDEDPSHTGKEVSDMETPPVNIAIDSDGSDSEEENAAHMQMGYQPLSQDPNGHGQEDDDEDGEDVDIMIEANAAPHVPAIDHAIARTLDQVEYPAVGNNFPDTPDAEIEERKEIWSKPHKSTPMSKDDADKIKGAMLSFALPQCAHPVWAQAVSEDEWKRRLYAKLNIPVTPTAENTLQNNQNHPSTSQCDLSTSKNTVDSPSPKETHTGLSSTNVKNINDEFGSDNSDIEVKNKATSQLNS